MASHSHLVNYTPCRLCRANLSSAKWLLRAELSATAVMILREVLILLKVAILLYKVIRVFSSSLFHYLTEQLLIYIKTWSQNPVFSSSRVCDSFVIYFFRFLSMFMWLFLRLCCELNS